MKRQLIQLLDRLLRWIPALGAAAILMAACSSGGQSVQSADGTDGPDAGQSVDDEGTTSDEGVPVVVDPDALTTGSWTLRFGGGPDGEIVPVDGYPITLTFDGDGSFGGPAGCNGYGGTYGLDGSELKLGQLGWEDVGCEQEVLAAESAFLAALSDVGDVNLGQGELALGGPATELIFAQSADAPVESLVGRTWLLEATLADGTESAAQGEPATLVLEADETFSGSTGCRTLVGRYTVFGSEILFNEMAADGQCPSALAGQDSNVVSALGDGFTVEVDGDQLVIASAGGQGLRYRAVEDVPSAGEAGADVTTDEDLLSGVQWIFAGGDSPDGELTDPRSIDPEAAITLTFVGDAYEGEAVCNTYGGTADVGVSLETVSLGVAEGEQEGCGAPFDGPDSVVEKFLSALPQISEGGIESDGLALVLNGNDIELLFERAE